MADKDMTPKVDVLSPEKIADAVKKMSSADMVKLRLAVAQAGIPLEDAAGITRLKDGSIQFSIVVPAEIVEPMSQWDRGGSSEIEFYRAQVAEALQAHLYGGWQQPGPVAVTTPGPITTTNSPGIVTSPPATT